MAINFLNSVDLNQNQLIKAAIESQPNDATAGTGVDGQLYYDTTLDKVKVWTGSAWESISGDLTALTEGTYINIDNPSGPIPTINHDLTTRPANTTSTDSPGYGGTFTVIDSVTSNTTGHVTAANELTITLPDDTNETYTLPTSTGETTTQPLSGKIELTAGGTGSGVKSTVNFVGTTNRIQVSGAAPVSAVGDITFDLTDDVSIVDDLTVGGIIIQSQTGETNSLASKLNMNGNKITNVGTGTVSTDGVNLGQVELLVAGVGVFQGGYNATTDPGVPVISGTSNIKLDLGDYFVVSHDGDITFSDATISVEVGDFIFANAAIAADSDPASTEYTFVQADANIAGAGATDGATEKGVAGFDSANFNVSASGWVQLDSQKNPYGARVALNNTSPVARTTSGTPVDQTTFSVSIDDASIFGTGALAANVKVEVLNNVSPLDTVYPLVERSGSGTLAVKFTGDVAVDLYQVLLTHI